MKTTKLLTISAVASTLFPIASLAAIDDQGMQYVTAAEGLHGSLRVHILHNEDKDPNDGVANSATDVTKGGSKESSRLWITGSGDIGNGFATTYYWEVRDGDPGTAGTIGTNAWDIGIKGAYGSVNFGRLGMVAPRLVPGGSLDTVAGANAEHFASDPDNNGLRIESAVFNGFQVGISGTANGVEVGNEDDLIDEYSLAVKYTSPLGFQVGLGYEVDIMHSITDRYGAAIATNPTATRDYDDKSGWRFGARYGQDNWLLGYEYRNYSGFAGWTTGLGFDASNNWLDSEALAILATAIAATVVTDRRSNGSRYNIGTDFNQLLTYNVHRGGVQVKFDRITASAGYSLETMELGVTGAADLERTALAIDAAYHLGRNSLLALGWKKVDTEVWRPIDATTLHASNSAYASAINIGTAATGPESTTTQLYYRVDF